jgi:Zn-dependent protease
LPREPNYVFLDTQGNPLYYQTYGQRPKWMLSPEERYNLLLAMGALTLALMMVFHGGLSGFMRAVREVPLAVAIFGLISVVTTVTGFAMHELAHKYVAQRYNCWAEFRYSLQGLFLALFTAALGFLVAAPGAVYIVGRVTDRQNGLISIAGPMTNVVVALAVLPLIFFGGLIGFGAIIVAFFNAFLAAFNMIPIGVLDGAKVVRWSIPAYIAALVPIGILLYLTAGALYDFGPLDWVL